MEELFGAGMSLSFSHTIVTAFTIGSNLNVCLKICKVMSTLGLKKFSLYPDDKFQCVVKIEFS